MTSHGGPGAVEDWVDIAAVVEAGAVDVGRVREGLLRLVGPQDPRLARWDDLRG